MVVTLLSQAIFLCQLASDIRGDIRHVSPPLTVNWLNPDKTLQEQGIEETSILTLRKKFFFSDQTVDRNDPVQLNLLYMQVS